MADIYLSSVDGSDSDDGSTWALAKATLAAALTAAGAGGRVFMDDNHAETQASAMALTSPGTAASPTQVLCVDRTGNPEPPTALATTATVSTTGNNNIYLTGHTLIYGVSFTSGQHIAVLTNAIAGFLRLEQSTLSVGTSTGFFEFGYEAAQKVELVDVTLNFSAVGQQLYTDCRFSMVGGSIAGTAPTTLINHIAGASATVTEFVGVDLSLLGSGKNFLDASRPLSTVHRLTNCKLGASVSFTTGTNPGQGGPTIEVVNCDSADTNYRYRKACYQGDVYHETTIVLAASDGTTTFSRKMTTSANSKLYSPLVFEGPLVWNETVGSAVTATIEVVTDNVTLTDKEAWLEIEYMGTSGFPLSLFADDRAADNAAFLGSGTNQTTSSASWTTTGLSTPVKQKFAVTFTPQEKGWIRGRVMLAKASTTMYVDPLMTLS